MGYITKNLNIDDLDNDLLQELYNARADDVYIGQRMLTEFNPVTWKNNLKNNPADEIVICGTYRDDDLDYLLLINVFAKSTREGESEPSGSWLYIMPRDDKNNSASYVYDKEMFKSLEDSITSNGMYLLYGTFAKDTSMYQHGRVSHPDISGWKITEVPYTDHQPDPDNPNREYITRLFEIPRG